MGNIANKTNTRESICSCLWDDGTMSKGQDQIQRKRVRPLLCDLEKDFKSVADKDGKVSIQQLSLLWQRAAERKVGKLSKQEIQYMDHCAKTFAQVMDIDNSGRIDFEEFSMWMLGDYKEHAVLQRMRTDLADSPHNQDITAVKEIVKLFRKYDVNHDGFIDRREMVQHMEELVQIGRSSSNFDDMERRSPGLTDEAAKDISKEIMKEVEVSPDGRIDLWDVLAHALGRRKTPVELLLYDISNGVSQKFSPLLLGRKFEAIYHSSVLVFGSEYWYGGEVFRTVPPCKEQFGPPLSKSVAGLQPSQYDASLLVVPLGYTLTTMNEFHAFLIREMQPKYTAEAYDVLTHNCNNFSNEAVQFLSGYGIPKQVRELPALVMQTPTARLLRPVLNKWLGGFGDVNNNSLSRDKHQEVSTPKEFNLFVGDIVHVDLSSGEAGAFTDEGEVLATIVHQDNRTVDIRYFDVAAGEFVSMSGISRSRVKWRSMPADKTTVEAVPAGLPPAPPPATLPRTPRG